MVSVNEYASIVLHFQTVLPLLLLVVVLVPTSLGSALRPEEVEELSASDATTLEHLLNREGRRPALPFVAQDGRRSGL